MPTMPRRRKKGDITFRKHACVAKPNRGARIASAMVEFPEDKGFEEDCTIRVTVMVKGV